MSGSDPVGLLRHVANKPVPRLNPAGPRQLMPRKTPHIVCGAVKSLGYPVATRRLVQNCNGHIMTDIVNKDVRSRMMSSVRAKNTKLELEMRRRLFAMGLRYRLHRKDLPGTPDMVFPGFSTVIFIHGCFWHNHGCHLSTIPHTRRLWWKRKLESNCSRDRDVVFNLKKLGWRILIIWECSFRKPHMNRSIALDRIAIRASKFLKSNRSLLEIPNGAPSQ